MAGKFSEKMQEGPGAEAANTLADADGAIPDHLKVPAYLAGGGLLTILLWAARLSDSEFTNQMDSNLVSLLAVGGPALVAYGILEFMHTPEPPPAPTPSGKARMNTGLDAMVDDIEGRRAWMRRVAALIVGVTHLLIFRLAPNW